MKAIKYILILGLIFIFTSCSAASKMPEQSVLANNVKNYETQQLKNLEINLQNAVINFESWGKKEVKVEVETQIKGEDRKEKLGKYLEGGKPKVAFTEDVLTINEAAAWKYKNITISNKIKISAPCEIRNVLVSIKNGSFTSSGDIITSAAIKLANGDISFTRFQGSLDAEVTNGNILIESGRLSGTSKLISQSGNVNVKTEILTKESYKFEAGVGSVELKLPAKTYGDFLLAGNVVTNEFKSVSTGPKIVVSSKEGAIYLKKY